MKILRRWHRSRVRRLKTRTRILQARVDLLNAELDIMAGTVTRLQRALQGDTNGAATERGTQ